MMWFLDFVGQVAQDPLTWVLSTLAYTARVYAVASRRID